MRFSCHCGGDADDTDGYVLRDKMENILGVNVVVSDKIPSNEILFISAKKWGEMARLQLIKLQQELESGVLCAQKREDENGRKLV